MLGFAVAYSAKIIFQKYDYAIVYIGDWTEICNLLASLAYLFVSLFV